MEARGGTRLQINTTKRKGPTRVDLCLRVTGGIALLVVLFYVLRPVYWAIEDRLVEYRMEEEAEAAANLEAEQAAGLTKPKDPATSLAAGEQGGGAASARELEAKGGGGKEGAAESTAGAAGAAEPEPLKQVKAAPVEEQNAQAEAEKKRKEEEEDKKEDEEEKKEEEKRMEEKRQKKEEEEKAAAALAAASASKPSEAAAGALDQSALAKGVRPIIHEGKPLMDILKKPIWERPPAGTPLPAKEEFKLRREMVEVRAKKNVIIVTFANFAFMDFVTNLVRHLTDLGVSNVLIGAMDHKLLEGLFFEGVPVFDLESGMPDIDAGWGTPLFHKMGREKVTLVNIFLAMGFELFICDTDVTFVRDPLPFIARFPEADVLASSDTLSYSVNDESLEHWDRCHGAYNIGLLHFRPTDAAKRFAREWAELLDRDEKIWDQNGFNDLMRKKLGPDVEGLDNNVFWAYDGSLKMGILPVSIFCSGHTFFVQSMYKVLGLKPYAFHTTFQFAGTEGKRHRFRESAEFFDPPEYYAPSNGLITFVNRIPPEILSEGEHTLTSHFALVNYQLKNLRQALAFATILNRTLVLPEMWCRFERMWFPHNGILEGTVTRQPFICPFDHVIEVHRMIPGRLSNDEFGPAVDFREYSFLNNTRTPAAVKESKLQVVLCDRSSEKCTPGSEAPATGGAAKAVYLPKEPQQNEISAALKDSKEFQLIEVSQIEQSFGGWDDQAAGEKFNKRIRHYVGIWCCIAATPGHIYYDFFAADKPGWKPIPPTGWQTDHPAWER